MGCLDRIAHAAGEVILQARRESQANQGFLPPVGQRAVIAVASAQDDAAELGDNAQRVVEDLGRDVVAIHQDRDPGFTGCDSGFTQRLGVGLP